MHFQTKRIAWSVVGLLAATLAVARPAVASADAPSPYEGMYFPTVYGPSDPEDYSWTVELGEEQVLREVDDQHAVVRYSDGMRAFEIWAEPAHDAIGTSVPTTIAVSERNVITLTVHHRAGDPVAGGTPFDYPVSEGAGWTGGFVTIYVELTGPSPPVQFAKPTCLVPSLTGREPQNSKRILLAANCKLGRVHHQRAGSSVKTVVRQGPKPGTELPWGSRVWITVSGA